VADLRQQRNLDVIHGYSARVNISTDLDGFERRLNTVYVKVLDREDGNTGCNLWVNLLNSKIGLQVVNTATNQVANQCSLTSQPQGGNASATMSSSSPGILEFQTGVTGPYGIRVDHSCFNGSTIPINLTLNVLPISVPSGGISGE
jgi:hypothetical protein